ncbi:phytanoyl-CoA dioxygenase family protein [Aquicella lusitana]|uniref:Ectoine hydroxylase-related dioxygenase (Phytanoyl-CoA dioxygenase family) n=1 Tax=Aquicella lusitana TaxID=254246 RepID=A0A370GWX7_9COXI|nr:phytanoyl-CoA dioxygenase family protein [Aquicella lusitana]RDI48167.1 ectoine hydroxylase-related dioxygenase (phytanoyl-CoA dioxygenase family) [Aquicella lusitana]VVC72817.1 hypothetical protein AQULUS_05410 [Aquicella lusitana]
MTNLSYGLTEASECSSDLDIYLEEISLQGYTVIKSVFSIQKLPVIREKIYTIYRQQELKIGREALMKIGDENICRCPMAYDRDFVEYATNNIFMTISEYFLGNYFILSVQNANISKPNLKHVQAAWHRDLPYQNFTTSKPLAINFLVAIDDFTVDNGGVVVLPFSHKMEAMPSKEYIERHAKIITAKAGDVISFDSMLIHRAGVNRSASDRCSFNHMYTRPFIKQQYDYARLMKEMGTLDQSAYQLSGASSRTAHDDVDWREVRKEKMGL